MKGRRTAFTSTNLELPKAYMAAAGAKKGGRKSHPVVVAATNDSSIVSKRSMARLGYEITTKVKNKTGRMFRCMNVANEGEKQVTLGQTMAGGRRNMTQARIM